MAEPIKSILIVGGGTAGWMAAAALNRSLGPHCAVTLVESDDIGIVGVGEATVPPIRDFNALVGLDEAELFRETQATIKLAIEFVDWGRIGGRYLHPFGAYGLGSQLGEFAQTWLALRERGLADDIEAYSLCAQAALRGRASLRVPDPKSPLSLLFSAYHFDAGLYARYLRRVCEDRGVKRVEGEIVEVRQRSGDGFVSDVKLKDGRTLDAELFIDCTGFRGLLIEGTLKAGYQDWSRWLPMDRAMAAPCARVGEPTPYTRATAREAGWRWRIPLQHRTGNGLVYCSDFLSDEAAHEDLVGALDGDLLAEPRRLAFTTGRRCKTWDRNVVALGLSSGFIEPLESTSIHMIQSGIHRLLQHFPDATFSPVNIAAYNRRVSAETELIRDFVILHYHATQRDDSPFWRHVAAMSVPDSLSERVEAFRDRGLLYQVGADEYFSQSSWLAVMLGQNLIPRGRNPLYGMGDMDRAEAAFREMKTRIAATADALPSHDAFLTGAGMMAAR